MGQIGGFFRVPLGYTQLYAVCSQVGADAVPPNATHKLGALEHEAAMDGGLAGYRWMTIVLFGESVGHRFERGVGQYPTVGDEVHFVTGSDLALIYGRVTASQGLSIGQIASSGGIEANLDLDRFVSRHSAIVGSTGSGKSNLVSVILETLSAAELPSARILVIDPHGEYSSVAPSKSSIFRISPSASEHALVVPFWALPFDELLSITFGAMSPANEASVRDMVQELKRDASTNLVKPPPIASVTADSPVPFSLRKLWFELDDFEKQTFRTEAGQRVPTAVETAGNADTLTSNVYPLHAPGGKEPFKNPSPRGISKQLELAKSRLSDARYDFLFNPPGGYSPDLLGNVASDIDGLVASWIGNDRPLTILDVSELPSDVAVDVVGLLLRIVYDALFWAGSSAIAGRSQPLLIMVDEAHRFLAEGGSSSCHRILMRIAKEGRKYGVGLSVITQRPSEIDSTVLSQCGTMIALRTTNASDRSRVSASFPDDLGGLVELLPSLRTGEALLVGEAMFVPSRVRIRMASKPSTGSEPKASDKWTISPRPDTQLYANAIENWRKQFKE